MDSTICFTNLSGQYLEHSYKNGLHFRYQDPIFWTASFVCR